MQLRAILAGGGGIMCLAYLVLVVHAVWRQLIGILIWSYGI